MSSCCPSKKPKTVKIDWILHGSLAVIILSFGMSASGLLPFYKLNTFTHTLQEILLEMSWGVALGLISVGLMNKIPREYFTAVMGKGDTFKDITKAAIAGVILDLCNHGILVVSGKLYERGLSTAQVLTFLIASPWNSMSLTFILIALIGFGWTLMFILASMVIAIISGLIFLKLTQKQILPKNPNTCDLPDDLDVYADLKTRLKSWKPSWAWFKTVAKDGWKDGQMIIRWILFGAILAAALRAFVPSEMIQEYLGPTLAGLAITLVFATIIEICSEGSAPIAAEIMNSANAPGNGFTFLMAGVATDYTEILIVREFTKSWKVALTIPLVTVPQILILGYIFNIMG